jgi:hypothetical protein
VRAVRSVPLLKTLRSAMTMLPAFFNDAMGDKLISYLVRTRIMFFFVCVHV